MRIHRYEGYLPTVDAASPDGRCEEGGTDEPEDHGHEQPSHFALAHPRAVNRGTFPVHNELNDDGDGGFGQGHEHHEEYPREQSPDGAENKVARSGADKARKSEKTSIDIPDQVTRETKLEEDVRMAMVSTVVMGMHLHYRKDDGEAQDG